MGQSDRWVSSLPSLPLYIIAVQEESILQLVQLIGHTTASCHHAVASQLLALHVAHCQRAPATAACQSAVPLLRTHPCKPPPSLSEQYSQAKEHAMMLQACKL